MPVSEQTWLQRWSSLELRERSSVRRARVAIKPIPFLNGWYNPTRTMLSDATKMRISALHAAVQERRRLLQPHVESFSLQTRKTAHRTLRISRKAVSYAMQVAQSQLEGMSFVQALIAACLGALLLLLIFLVLARSQSSRRILNVRRGMLPSAGSSSEKRSLMSVMEDSDEHDDFEDEEEDEDLDGRGSTDGGGGTGVMKRFRTAFSGRRRGGATASGSEKHRKRPNSIIRITSSDPRSRLSIHAMQMDLDPHGTQLRGTSSSSYRSSGSSSDGTSANGSLTRRRRESGRLSTDEQGSSTTSTAPTPSSAQATGLPRAVHTAARAAKQRRFARGSVDQDRKRATDTTTGRRSSMSSDDGRSSLLDSPSSMHSFASALSGNENPWNSSIYGNGPQKLASILRREPQFYASLPQLPFLSSGDTDKEPAIDHATSWRTVAAAASSTSSSSTDIHVDQNAAFNVLPSTSTLQSGQSRLPPGAGRPGCSPLRTNSNPVRLGSLTPDQMRAIWPDKKARTLKLREPDWSPYASVHERARERMEKYAEIQRSESPMSIMTGSDEGSGKGSHLTTVDDDDETFWYEKYTRSTAASGRDWDWRKRRARQAALRRAASLDSASLSKPLPSEPDQIASRSTSIGNTTSPMTNGMANVNRSINAFARSNTSPRLHVAVNGDGLGFNSAVFPYSNDSPQKKQDDGALFAPQVTPPNRRIRSYSDIDQRDADSATNVPGRLSSLKPKGGVRRMLSRRDKNGVGAPESPQGRRSSEDRHSPPRTAELQTTPNGWTRSLELTTGDGRSISADVALRQHGTLRKSTSLANLNPAFTDSAPDLHEVRRAPQQQMQSTRQVSPLAVTQRGPWTEMQSAWSSADAYGTAPSSPNNVTPRQNGMRSNSLFAEPEGRDRTSAVIPPDLANMYGQMMFGNDGMPPTQPLPSLPRSMSASATANGDRPLRPQRRGTEPDAKWTNLTLSGLSPTTSAHSTATSPSLVDEADRRVSNPSKRAIVANARSASQRRA